MRPAARVPIPAISEGDTTVTFTDLIVSKEWIDNFLLTRGISEETTDQLSPKGLALIANYYNRKGDQYCPILIASTNQDLQHIACKIGDSEPGTKVVIIFQATDNYLTSEIELPALHKTVVYLEKTEDMLLILHIDSTPIVTFSFWILAKLHVVLIDTPWIMLLQKPLQHPTNYSNLFMQRDYYRCGIHALRLARAIAKNSNFMAQFQEILDGVQAGQTVYYDLPYDFLRSADNDLFRTQGLKLHNNRDCTAMLARFKKYCEPGSYIDKFSSKYMHLADLFVRLPPERVYAALRYTDAKNYNRDACNHFKLRHI